MRDHVRICGSPGRETDRGHPAHCVLQPSRFRKPDPAPPHSAHVDIADTIGIKYGNFSTATVFSS